jgi:hypothetical protein
VTQDEFIAILFIDCCIESTAQRKAYIFARFEKNYSDELNVGEKSKLISALQALKRHQQTYLNQK